MAPARLPSLWMGILIWVGGQYFQGVNANDDLSLFSPRQAQQQPRSFRILPSNNLDLASAAGLAASAVELPSAEAVLSARRRRGKRRHRGRNQVPDRPRGSFRGGRRKKDNASEHLADDEDEDDDDVGGMTSYEENEAAPRNEGSERPEKNGGGGGKRRKLDRLGDEMEDEKDDDKYETDIYASDERAAAAAASEEGRVSGEKGRGKDRRKQKEGDQAPKRPKKGIVDRGKKLNNKDQISKEMEEDKYEQEDTKSYEQDMTEEEEDEQKDREEKVLSQEDIRRGKKGEKNEEEKKKVKEEPKGREESDREKEEDRENDDDRKKDKSKRRGEKDKDKGKDKDKSKKKKEKNLLDALSKLEEAVEEILGRPRQTGTLGKAVEFNTDLQTGMQDFDLDLEVLKVQEDVKQFKFRKDKLRRKLEAPVHRWEHKPKVDPKDPEGCGFPICVIIQSRPKRFPSLCNFTAWMKQEGFTRRVFEIQKGGCEDAIEGKGHDRPWLSEAPSKCDCKDHEGCKQSLCVNADGHAKSFDNVCNALKDLKDRSDKIVVAVGLGTCKQLYTTCLFTEWFDLDEPCREGEVESVYVTNIYATFLGEQGRHRSCAAHRIKYPAEFQTLEGHDKVDHLIYSVDKDKVVCHNSKNKKKQKPPFFWVDKEVTCRDWRMRYCCHHLWGEAVTPANLPKNDVVVDKPIQKTLFDDCEWLNFMSVGIGSGVGDVETRQRNFPFFSKSTCKLTKFSALFVDARRVKDDKPWDETGELITKNSPIFGFYCDNKNNKVSGKKCSDYKVRFCCKKEKASQWGKWGKWSDCSKSCGGGKRKRDRVCVKKKGEKLSCFNDGPHGDKRFKEMEEECNKLPCPKDLQWQPWNKWSDCSVTCGKGTRKRQRACFPPRNGGKDCPPGGDKQYSEQGHCHEKPCAKPEWTPWEKFGKCSVSCSLGTKSRWRTCVDVANGNAPLKAGVDCLGPAVHDNDCDAGHCPVDGAWTEWQNWGECNKACGKNGKRKQLRYCTNPFPVHGGKKCQGEGEKAGPCEKLRPCPEHCLFSEWGEWSTCSVTCGPGPEAGTRVRHRHIAQPAKHGGLKCQGSKEEATNCVFCGHEDKAKSKKHPEGFLSGEHKHEHEHGEENKHEHWDEQKDKHKHEGEHKDEHEQKNKHEHEGEHEKKHEHENKEEHEKEGKKREKRDTGDDLEKEDSKKDLEKEDKKKGDDHKKHDEKWDKKPVHHKCIKRCPIDCVVSEWTQWQGTCRKCYKPSQKKYVSRVKRTRQRFVDIAAEHGGKPCKTLKGKELTLEDGSEVETRPCKPDRDVIPCPSAGTPSFWSAWEEWSECSAKCGKKGKRTRRRTCHHLGRKKGQCKGKDVEHDSCETICPPDGWTEWDQWAPCEKTCGKGQTARKRTCRDDHRKDIKKEDITCKGIQRETRVCDSGDCNKHETVETAGPDVTGLAGGQSGHDEAGKKEEEAGKGSEQGEKSKEAVNESDKGQEAEGKGSQETHLAGKGNQEEGKSAEKEKASKEREINENGGSKEDNGGSKEGKGEDEPAGNKEEEWKPGSLEDDFQVSKEGKEAKENGKAPEGNEGKESLDSNTDNRRDEGDIEKGSSEAHSNEKGQEEGDIKVEEKMKEEGIKEGKEGKEAHQNEKGSAESPKPEGSKGGIKEQEGKSSKEQQAAPGGKGGKGSKEAMEDREVQENGDPEKGEMGKGSNEAGLRGEGKENEQSGKDTEKGEPKEPENTDADKPEKQIEQEGKQEQEQKNGSKGKDENGSEGKHPENKEPGEEQEKKGDNGMGSKNDQGGGASAPDENGPGDGDKNKGNSSKPQSDRVAENEFDALSSRQDSSELNIDSFYDGFDTWHD